MAKPFHIAVNARFLLKGRLEGLGVFAHEVLQRIVQQHPEVQFTFFFDRPFDPQFLYGPNVKGMVLPPQARHPLLWQLWFQWSLRRRLNLLQPDAFFSPDGFAVLRTHVRQVIVIHDLAFIHHPEDTHASHARYYQRRFPQFARVADHIFTVSEFCKQDIVQQYALNPADISVVGNAAAARFHPCGEAQQKAIRAKYTQGEPYFHYVGAIQPRKNLHRVMQAFALFKAQTQSTARLLIAGRKAWKFKEVEAVFEQSPVKEHIVFTGWVSDEELPLIYGSSMGLCYLPVFEGFGIPVVEAMQCGCPVITSDRTSLPEVAGDAALLADPSNVVAIAAQMKSLWSDEALRNSLRGKGLQRATHFSWDHTARAIATQLLFRP